MLSAVIDNNVLISGILNKRGIPGKILDAATYGRFILVTSDPLIEEFERVANKLSPKYALIAQHKNAILDFLWLHSIGNPPLLNALVVQGDPDDDRFLECAIEGHAGYIVSGNRHLLSLQEFRGINIVTPRGFLVKLSASMI